MQVTTYQNDQLVNTTTMSITNCPPSHPGVVAAEKEVGAVYGNSQDGGTFTLKCPSNKDILAMTGNKL